MLSSCCDLSFKTLLRLVKSLLTKCLCLSVYHNKPDLRAFFFQKVTWHFWKKTAVCLCSLHVRVVVRVTESATIDLTQGSCCKYIST